VVKMDSMESAWRCGKCDGLKVPEHHRTWPLRMLALAVLDDVSEWSLELHSAISTPARGATHCSVSGSV
jgi:hypothetical protein